MTQTGEARAGFGWGSLIKPAVLGGLTAGAIDIIGAMAVWGAVRGASPEQILQSVASGLYGKSAYAGGWPVAAHGLGLHFLISLGAAGAYVAASRRWPDLARRPLLWGTLFGLAMFMVMNFVVLPLSAAGMAKFEWATTPLNIALHVFGFGPAIALWARHYAVAQA